MDLQMRQQLLSLSALFASLAIAVLFFLIVPRPRVERTLFFPGAIQRTLTGETRLVPPAEDRREALRVVVEEVILGPVSIESTRALPKQTNVNIVALRDDTAYIDLSHDVVFDEEGVNLTFDERIQALIQSIRFNFRSIDQVVVTVGGQTAYAPHYNLPESRN